MRQGFYRSPLVLSILLHVLLFVALLWHFSFDHRTPLLGKPSDHNIISAVMMDSRQINPPTPTPTAAPTPKPVLPPKPVPAKQVQTPLPAKPAVSELPAPPKSEAKQPTQKMAEKMLEQPKLTPPTPKKEVNKQANVDFAKALQEQQAAELAAERTKVEKAKIQQKKSEAAAKLAQQKAVEKQKQLEQEQIKAAEQKALQQQLAQEQQSLAAASAESTEQIKSELDKYKALIIQAISQNWIVPTDVNRELSCELLIQVGPGGAVLNVQIARSSGDPGLDNSARTAVYKASPLPVPEDPDLFEHFRQLRLTVKPQNLVEG